MAARPVNISRPALSSMLAGALALSLLTAPSARAVTVRLQVWLSTPGGAKLAQQPDKTLDPLGRGSINVVVDDSLRSQTFTGVGAAFTDSSTNLLNRYKSFDPVAYDGLVRSLFTAAPADGINMSVMRIPMGASDYISQ